jgi:hypothetical protein
LVSSTTIVHQLEHVHLDFDFLIHFPNSIINETPNFKETKRINGSGNVKRKLAKIRQVTIGNMDMDRISLMRSNI